ncbi:MAG: HAMP domain-containing histidine kinase [Clostridia bacterium]|nr:HAMP domain-containing histidine kinase [Clostridia bacterium]
MKESRILQTICYIIIPILVGGIILSTISIITKNDYYDSEKYFQSDSFVSKYISNLSYETSRLIYDNGTYYNLKDGEKTIYYETDGLDMQIKNMYFLIIYKNKAITNVELTEETSTIDSIKKYINENNNSKRVSLINGEINSESEAIQKRGIKYLDSFSKGYYTVNKSNEGEYRDYITTKLEDFEIYTSYLEEFAEDSGQQIAKEVLEDIKPLGEYSYFIIPTNVVLIILSLLYLIISIGHKKGVEGVALNDFDKIPLEIIFFVEICIGCIPFAMMSAIEGDHKAIISLIVTGFLLIYILGSIGFNTLIKRIKAKMMLKTTITGRIILFVLRIMGRFIKKCQKAIDTLKYSINKKTKIIVYWIIATFAVIIIYALFYDTAMLLLVMEGLITFIFYKIMKVAQQYSQIEGKLQEMYEGNNQNKLYVEEFEPSFKKSVEYINDISNGFENAIQDRIKSEKLKAELITNVSHDIKTPLTSIINYVDLLKQERIENEKATEYINILDSKSQRLKKLTEDLVEASKVSTGNISLNLEKINIVELVRQALGEFEDKFQKRNLKTIIDAKENEINIMADSRYMFRVVENLFSNISKYALEGSRVYVDIKKEKGEGLQYKTIVEIKNISKDKLNISADELMQRFVRGDKSRTTEGSGLGISIAQNLTELQNGEFRLKLDGDLFKVELEFEVK